MNRPLLRWLIPATALVIFARLIRRTDSIDLRKLMSRRALIKLAGLSAAATAVGGWRKVLAAPSSPAQIFPEVSCVLSPEMTEGPYYVANEKVRRNITEHHPGMPLDLKLTVVDASTCKPIKGAAVDIWHCDAAGDYSSFDGGVGSTTFLRGIQPTNARGLAEFNSIYPGWYQGRTVHIHVKVHLGGSVVHTGQLFFPDTLTDKVYRTGAYASRPARTTRNVDDSIYAAGGAQSTLTLKHLKSGYTGTIVLGVRR